MITIKSEKEIELIRHSCMLLSKVLKKVEENIKPGIKTKEIDSLVEKTIFSFDAVPSFKGYMDYKYACNVSVNDIVIHGLPSDYIIKEGDIVSVDAGVYKNLFHSDAARTYIIGDVDSSVRTLVEETRNAFYEGLKFCKEGFRVSDISKAIQKHAEKFNFGILRDFTGHGIGKKLHEDPMIPNYDMGIRGPRLKKGMVLAIEPMFTLGSEEVLIIEDGWSVQTVDGSLSSHYENTVLITHDEPEVLTNLDEV